MRSNAQGAALAGGACDKPVAASSGGKPMTQNERRVLQELSAAGAPMKAYALLERLQDDGIRAPMTVYRALEALIDRGAVKKVASQNAYVAVKEKDAQAVGAYVICRRCGRTHEVSLDEALIAGMLAPAGMAIDDVFIEAYGDCCNAECDAS